MPLAALLVVQDSYITRDTIGIKCFNAARGFVGGARSELLRKMQHLQSFNAARGFVGGARSCFSGKAAI